MTAMNGRARESRAATSRYTSFLQPPAVYRYDLDTRNTRSVPRDAARLVARAVRDDAALLHEQGRHARADVHHGATRNHARWLAPDAPRGRRSFNVAGDAGLLARDRGVASSWAASTPSRTCAAAAKTDARGTTRRRARKSRSSFDDFIAAADFLINQRYTRSASLAVVGRGAGGLLAGRRSCSDRSSSAPR